MGQTYNITFTGTNPRDMRFHIRDDADAIGTVISIQYGTPELLQVYVESDFVVPSDSPVALTDGTGANYYEFLPRRLTFVVKGPSMVFIKTVDAVHVNLALDTTMKDFYDGGGEEAFVDRVAYILGIDPKLIKIASVRSGSVIIDFAIMDTQELAPNITSLPNGTLSLNETASLVYQVLTNGTLSFGVPILRYSVLISQDPTTPCMPLCGRGAYCHNATCYCLPGFTGNGTVCHSVTKPEKTPPPIESADPDAAAIGTIVAIVICSLCIVMALSGALIAFRWRQKYRMSEDD